eukprot:scaffold17228_cov49-Cyclotella_meneghiniana.AAC.7
MSARDEESQNVNSTNRKHLHLPHQQHRLNQTYSTTLTGKSKLIDSHWPRCLNCPLPLSSSKMITPQYHH